MSVVLLGRRWKRVKHELLVRQHNVLKQKVYAKKEAAERFVIALPKNINVAFVRSCHKDAVVLLVYDVAGSYMIELRASWLLAVRYYTDARTLVIRYTGRYPFNSFLWGEHSRVISAFHTMFVMRLKMRGRLYRIYRRNKFRDLQYRIGFSHYITVFVEGFYAKYIRKKRIRLFGFNYLELLMKAREARDRYPVCKYTQRGVRLGGDRCFVKIGKTMKYY